MLVKLCKFLLRGKVFLGIIKEKYREDEIVYKYLMDVENIIEKMFATYNLSEKSEVFYKGRILKFFTEYMGLVVNQNKPLNAITYFDINTYLQNLMCSKAEIVNIYAALKRFFEYSYYKNITKEVMSQVKKPIYIRKSKKTLNNEEYYMLKKFICCKENDINERLILGLFLFTGLSRKYIASLRMNQFLYEDGVYKLVIWKDEDEVKLPLKSELQLIINEYFSNLSINDKLEQVIKMPENSISTYIGNLVKKIINKQYTPTILSNTFISKALSNGNYVWEVSKLTLESVSVIYQHIIDSDNLIYKQTSILNSF